MRLVPPSDSVADARARRRVDLEHDVAEREPVSVPRLGRRHGAGRAAVPRRRHRRPVAPPRPPRHRARPLPGRPPRPRPRRPVPHATAAARACRPPPAPARPCPRAAAASLPVAPAPPDRRCRPSPRPSARHRRYPPCPAAARRGLVPPAPALDVPPDEPALAPACPEPPVPPVPVPLPARGAGRRQETRRDQPDRPHSYLHSSAIRHAREFPPDRKMITSGAVSADYPSSSRTNALRIVRQLLLEPAPGVLFHVRFACSQNFAPSASMKDRTNASRVGAGSSQSARRSRGSATSNAPVVVGVRIAANEQPVLIAEEQPDNSRLRSGRGRGHAGILPSRARTRGARAARAPTARSPRPRIDGRCHSSRGRQIGRTSDRTASTRQRLLRAAQTRPVPSTGADWARVSRQLRSDRRSTCPHESTDSSVHVTDLLNDAAAWTRWMIFSDDPSRNLRVQCRDRTRRRPRPPLQCVGTLTYETVGRSVESADLDCPGAAGDRPDLRPRPRGPRLTTRL